MRKALALLAVLFLIPSFVVGQSQRDSLAGLPGVSYALYLPTDLEQLRVSPTELGTTVELRLRESGVRVLYSKEDRQYYGFLEVSIFTYDMEDGTSVYTVGAAYHQNATLQRFKSSPSFSVVTWQEKGVYGVANNSEIREPLKEAVKAVLEKFINDYLAANPKR